MEVKIKSKTNEKYAFVQYESEEDASAAVNRYSSQLTFQFVGYQYIGQQDQSRVGNGRQERQSMLQLWISGTFRKALSK